jgi:serine/threonine-protein kinase
MRGAVRAISRTAHEFAGHPCDAPGISRMRRAFVRCAAHLENALWIWRRSRQLGNRSAPRLSSGTCTKLRGAMTTVPLEPWRALGVEETAALDIGETITAHTFARAAEGRAAVGSIHLDSLPRIALTSPGHAASHGAVLPPAAGGDFDVISVLGEGGMGRVLCARQRSLQRDVAVKVVKDEVDDASVVEALFAEAVVTGSLEHPGIVPVHALGRDHDGRPVLVMKRVEGVSWHDLACDPRHPAWATVETDGDDRVTAHVRILMQVSSALHFAHRRGIVHRDVKPANVMIGAYGEVYLLDWGIAAHMGARAEPRLVGTPGFMAPEMVGGDPALADARTDVYLLGATLHNLLTGELRNPGAHLFDALLAARDSAPRAYGPDVPPELAALCNKATSRKPEDRFESAAAFRRALAEYLRHRGSVTLAEQASAQLAELRAGSSEDSHRRARLMTECRFGFRQALREWSDNQAARAGLGACLALMIEEEIAQQDREGAARLIAELPEPRPDLEARLAELDRAIAERREREALLQKLQRDNDPSIDARPRALLAGLVLVCAAAGGTAVLSIGVHLDTRRSTVLMGALNAVLVTAVVAGRKRLFTTQISSVATGTLIVWGLTLLGHRAYALNRGTPIGEVLTIDLWVTAAILAMLGLGVRRFLWLGAVLAASGALAMAILPEYAIQLFGVFSTVAACVLLYGAIKLIK